MYHSNAIEGNTLSYAETYAIIFNDNAIKVNNVTAREIYEAINTKYALSYVLDHIEEELSDAMIQKIGIYINRNISEIDGYRKYNVLIRGAEYLPPDAGQIRQAMMYYVYNYHNTVYDNPFQKAADNHIKFERIHPFSDGNGRTSRILINYELIRSGQCPVVIPKDEKNRYFEFLANRDVGGLQKYLEELSEIERQRMKHFIKETC